MHFRNIIVIGASAGGVETLTQLVQALPSDLSASLFVTLHFPSDSISVLPKILNRCGTLPVSHAEDGEAIQLNRIYVAPPNYHLIVRPQVIHLSRSPRENGHRPAIDALFRSAARAYGSQVIGVILSGMLDDGTAGLANIKANGGLAFVQDPAEALFEGMPRSAIASVEVDGVLSVTAIAAQLAELSQTTITKKIMSDSTNSAEEEARIVSESKSRLEQGQQPETSPSMLTCPDCGGVMWEIANDNLVRYRCHVGHVYSLDSLFSEQASHVETALWAAIRALEEKAALARRMAKRSREQDHELSAVRFEERAAEAKQQAEMVRRVVSTRGKSTPNNGDEAL